MNDYYDDIFVKLILNEGGYADDPDDTGGQTYLGMTRRDNGDLKMWGIIDNIIKSTGLKGINAKLKAIPAVVAEAKKAYKQRYWDPIQLDHLTSKDLCYQIFDHAVNAGVGSAIGLAQELVGMKVTKKYSNDLLVKLKAYGKA